MDSEANKLAWLTESIRSIEDNREVAVVGGAPRYKQTDGVERFIRSWAVPKRSPSFRAEGRCGKGLNVPLAQGTVHEWSFESGLDRVRSAIWRPPLSVMAHLALSAVESSADGRRFVLWIGRRCWPYPKTLTRERCRAGAAAGLRRSIFVDPPDLMGRLWAIELAARSPAVAVVVADGSGLGMAATRRLQLAARHGGGLVLLARPWWERGELSAAATRWAVRPVPAPAAGSRADPELAPGVGGRPRWEVELLRCKGVQRSLGMEAGQTWQLEWDHATGALVTPAELADRPGAAASYSAEQTTIRRTG